MTFKLSLSPNVRLRMTVQQEMELDKDGTLFSDNLYQRYVEMHRQAIGRQEALLKTVFISDALLALVLSKKDFIIPGIGIALSNIPSVVHVLVGLSSFGFMLAALAFLNTQFYMAVVEQFNIRKAAPKFVDPDFLTAADILLEFPLKVFRSRLNVQGNDFFEAGRGYKVFYTTITYLMIISLFFVLLLHLSIIGLGLADSLSGSWLSWLFCAVVVLTNLVGIMSNLTVPFSFIVPGLARADEPGAPSG